MPQHASLIDAISHACRVCSTHNGGTAAVAVAAAAAAAAAAALVHFVPLYGVAGTAGRAHVQIGGNPPNMRHVAYCL